MFRSLWLSLFRNGSSPYGLTLVALFIFFCSWVFPPNIYSSYIGESDWVYLNPSTLAFFLICSGAFVSGCAAVTLLTRQGGDAPKLRLATPQPLVYLGLPLALMTLACIGYLVVLAGSINFVGLLLSQQGNAIKTALHSGGGNTSGPWIHALPWLTGTLWYSWYRVKQVEWPQRGTKTTFYALFSFGFFVDFLTCTATASRGSLIPLVSGLAIIEAFHRTRTPRAQPGRVVILAAFSVSLIVLLFTALSFLRGAGSSDKQISALIGYTVASYNRLAAITGGFMRYRFGGRGVYLFPVLIENEKLSNIMAARFNWPDYPMVWGSEFVSVLMAGLNKSFNWGSVFGYLYSDLGWFTPLYLFGAGIFMGGVWTGFQRGKLFALLYYPMLSFWVLFWIGSNTLMNVMYLELLVLGGLLFMYERYWIVVSTTLPASQPQERTTHADPIALYRRRSN